MADTAPPPITFRGVDHFMWVVRNLDAAPTFFRDSLGFAFNATRNDMSGIENFLIWFEDETYLEPLATTWADDPQALLIRHFGQTHEGAWQIGFNAEPLDRYAEWMRARGYVVFGPSAGTFQRMNGGDGLPEEMWQGMRSRQQPGNYLFFWHFTPGWDAMKLRVPDLDPTRVSTHPNTARGIRSAWVAVWDLEEAGERFRRLGMQASDTFDVEHLAAWGRRIVLPMGDIVLLQPRLIASPVREFLALRGENLMGISLEVADLERAREVVGHGLGMSFEPYDGLEGRSFRVPAAHAKGVNVEFFQPAYAP
ncbi:MAG: VOC family protein [Longimicrobiaceae bacterium]